VTHDAFLRSLDQIGRHKQATVGAGVAGGGREPNSLRPPVADAGDDREPTGRLLDGDCYERGVLVLGEREELTGAAAGKQRPRAGVDLRAHMIAKTVKVQPTVLIEGGERKAQDAALEPVA
jgi:hypothetical protein